MKRSSRTISLFTEPTDDTRQPVSFAVSILVHVLAIGVVSAGIILTPKVVNQPMANRYTVRHLDLQSLDELARSGGAGHIAYPEPRSTASAQAKGGKQAPHQPVRNEIAKTKTGPQTLLQPDLKTDLTLANEIPLPQVIVWQPTHAPVKNIVAPKPQKPTTANVTPSLDSPNEEVTLADIPLTSATQLPLHDLLKAGTTTPVVRQGPEQPPVPPATVSQTAAQPTPAAVLSLSDLRMKNGSASLPAVNETASANTQGALAPGDEKQPPLPGNSNPESKNAGSGTGHGSANTGSAEKSDPAGGAGSGGKLPADGAGPAAPNKAGNASGAGAANAAGAGSAQSNSNGAGQGNQTSATRITLPRDGQFGAVVVGTSLEDQYPELGDAWHGRMAYTVYLHMGQEKSWILQFSLPRPVDASQGGSVARLDAPWPYNIVRPDFTPGSIDADALIVHGFVNQDGRFDSLSVMFPENFAQAQFVLKSLEQWEFRPASQNGQNARIEILLIIPDQGE